MNLLPNKQLYIKVPFESTKYRMKELCVDNKVQETIGDVYCPTFRNEKCIFISANKMSSFYYRKKCKACCHVLKKPFMDQKPTIMLFGGDETHCFARKTKKDESRLQKRKTISFCEEISKPITIKHTRT